MRKGRYTKSFFLQAGLSQLPSTSISFKNCSTQFEKNDQDAQLSTCCMTTRDYTSLRAPTKRPQSSADIRSSTHRIRRALLHQTTICFVLRSSTYEREKSTSTTTSKQRSTTS
ncbi:hypothetical protein WR25_11371 [Diploscapter pachys]|uniref:Uncharacterized protein n=1 Tax=Diploscapter pachys TaxID=2018661 RepID=A0A2A2LK07_9BILA|nr:hypothetical protein WR25_11371 [Diploscapter pachys]